MGAARPPLTSISSDWTGIRALEILGAARKLGNGESPIVFVNERGRALTKKRPGRLLQSCGISAVPHGFRSSFRDWAAEKTDHPLRPRKQVVGL